VTANTAKLSKLQRSILHDLAFYEREIERIAPTSLPTVQRFGVPLRWLRPRKHEQHRTRADSAAFSRAILRLEWRGLVIRSNAVSGMPHSAANPEREGVIRQKADEPHERRTDHIILTLAGRKAA